MRYHSSAERPWQNGRGYRKRRLLEDFPLPAEVSLVQEVQFKKGDAMPPHLHKVQTEVFYALAPGSITIDGIDVRMGRGDILICEPGEVHGMSLVEEDFCFLVLKIDYCEDDTVWL
ncbi:MAG: cupin domain-containing protein [Euryarchaeota archaeon]|jgi:quercetin dioxygenase-like cupin family protein|nr:cupin domain-containing protein [Euryarchaeota archaeon]